MRGITRFSLSVVLVTVASSAAAAAQERPPLPSGADAFFDDTVVQEIRLEINEKDWQTLKTNYLTNDPYPCWLRWRDEVVRNVAIRSRGTGSRSGIKPGLRVDIDHYVKGQKFLGLKSFVLRNNTQDASNMHERLSMLLFRRLGEPASREAHARLYVKDRYEGLYTIVESVDKNFLKRSYDEDTGYLYKFDYPAGQQPFYFEDRGSSPSSYVPSPFQPETHEDNSRPEFVAQLIQTVNQASEAVFRTAVAEYLDLQKFIRHVAVEVFLGDYDGFLGNWGINNFYFYRFDNQKLFTFIPWDKSEAFKSGYTASIWHNVSDVPDAQKNRLMTRVLSYPDLYDAYLDALLDCVRSAGEVDPGSADTRGWLEREIEWEYAQIRDAARADPDKPYTIDQFEQAVSDLRTFASRRGASVAGEVHASRAR